MDEDYGQLLEEYRGLVKGLFSLLLERLYHSESELFKLRMQDGRRKEEEQIKMMQEALKE